MESGKYDVDNSKSWFGLYTIFEFNLPFYCGLVFKILAILNFEIGKDITKVSLYENKLLIFIGI